MEEDFKYAVIVLLIKKIAYCHDQVIAPTLFVNRWLESSAYKVVILNVSWKNRWAIPCINKIRQALSLP
jgi:hypothetical protein